MKDNFKKQLPLNLLANIGYFLLNVLIGIWMVPYLIRHLGVEGYGFIPLALSVTTYAGLITLALNGAVSRYLVIALQKGDAEGANRIFNTSFWSLAVLAVFLIPLAGLFAWFAPQIFSTPLLLKEQVQGLFFITLLSFIISVFSSIFSVSTFANNRLDLRNLVDISNLVVRTILIVLFFLCLPVSLVSVGAAYLAGGLTALAGGYVFFRKLTPVLKISFQYFDISRLKELTSMGGWLVINQIGSLLFLQIDLIVVNMFFGAQEAGRYGAVIQWSILLRSLAGVISGVLTPMVFISHAKEDTARIVSMSVRAVKFMGLGMAVPVGLLCGFSGPLLTVWLGKDFSGYAPLLCLLTFHLTVNLAVLPLFAINNALNRVKVPGWTTLIMGGCNLFLAVFWGKYCGWGVYGVAAAGAVILTLKNMVFTPVYAAHILGIPYTTFIKPVGAGVFLAGVGTAVGWGLCRVMVINGWLGLFIAGSLGLFAAFTIAWLILGKDRSMLVSLLKAR